MAHPRVDLQKAGPIQDAVDAQLAFRFADARALREIDRDGVTVALRLDLDSDRRSTLVARLGMLAVRSNGRPFFASGRRAVLQRELAVDEHVLHALGRQRGVLVGRVIDDRVRIEHDDVGGHAERDQARDRSCRSSTPAATTTS